MDALKTKQSRAWQVINLASKSLQSAFERWKEQFAPLLAVGDVPVDPADLKEFEQKLTLLRAAITRRQAATVAELCNDVLRGVDRVGLNMRYGQWDALRQAIAFITPRRARSAYSGLCLYLPRRVLRGHQAIVRSARKNPDRLFAMTPRGFEQLIAFVFQQNGFDVSLTPQTRDGGFDVVAENRVLGVPFKWLIECKRYARGRNITVETTRSLLGVLVDQRASRALLITTSGFTKAARTFADRNSPDIHLWSLADITAQLRACPL